MPRAARYTPGGMVFHILNRGVGRRTLFEKDADYQAFERVIDETLRTRPMRICAFQTIIDRTGCPRNGENGGIG